MGPRTRNDQILLAVVSVSCSSNDFCSRHSTPELTLFLHTLYENLDKNMEEGVTI